ncbi:MAG: AEC family transporter [Dehalococcoidia bacterium]|nr:AEC family transporter [Dehalococcoidia bacterium]
MNYFYALLGSLFILVALVLITLLLRNRSILSTEHQTLFSRLVTDFSLPALIFINLATRTFEVEQLLPALIMFITILIACSLGFAAGKILKMDKKSLGAFVLVSGWGSSSTLGYALIMQVFQNNHEAIQDALVISELGAGVPLFLLAIPVAMYFGREHPDGKSVLASTGEFFLSPIFIAVVLGIACSFLNLPWQNTAMKTLNTLLNMIGDSLEIFTAFAIGLMLQKIPLRHLLPPIAALFCINLIAEPLIALAGAHLFGLPQLEEQVLVIEASMPAGAVAAVIAARYGCNGGLASALTIAMYVLSLATIPLVYLLMMTIH